MRFSTRFCGLLTLLLASSTLALGHGSTTTHARRLEKRQVRPGAGLGDFLGVDLPVVSAGPIEVGPIELPPVVLDPSPTPTEEENQTLVPAPTSIEPTPTPTPTPDPASSTPAPTDPSSAPASSSAAPSSNDPTSAAPTSADPTSASPTSAPEPSSSQGGGIISSILSGIIDPVTSVVSEVVEPVTSAVSEIVAPVTSAVSEIVEPVTSAVSEIAAPITSAVSEIVTPITSAVVPPVSSAVSEIAEPITSVASEIVEPVTSVVVPPVSSAIESITSIVEPPVSSAISQITDPATELPPAVSSVVSQITDLPPTVSSVFSSIASEVTPPPLPSSVITDPPVSEPSSVSPSGPSQSEPPVSQSQPPSQSQEPSGSVEPPPQSQPSQSQPSQSQQPSQSEPTQSQSQVLPSRSSTIAFPSGSSSSLENEEPTPSASGSASPSSIAVDPDLTFILTESSLALAPVTTSRSVDPTLSDPDAATTSVAQSELALAASTTISVAALPTGLPNKIYPVRRLSPDTNLEGMTLISILFSSALNWPFVVADGLSSSQLFAFVPVLITTALETAPETVKTYALQVYIPTTYRTPSDAEDLGTMWLGYVPSDMVDTLASLIKAKNSRFYTAPSHKVARALAQQVNTGFSLLSVADPNGGGATGGGGMGGGGSQSGAAADGSKSRQDAIIGVVSALGAIAVLVLIFLVYRSLKRRKEMAHRRLSDPPGAADLAGYRGEGREFDQDSIGGQRRRSFYFAQDSLRTYQDQQQESYSYLQDNQHSAGYGATAYGGGAQQQQQMSQRRGVPQGGAISAPILQQSSMNW